MQDPWEGVGKAEDTQDFVTTDQTNNANQQTEPGPPPYESVMMSGYDGTGAGAKNADNSQQEPSTSRSDFQIEVRDPVKHGDGVSAHVSYKVTTKTKLPQYKKDHIEVIRRFKDFAWLWQRLQDTNRGIIVPPLPEKSAVQKFQMTADFIEQRRRALQVFINRVACHPSLKSSRDLQLFLETSEDEFAHEVARAQMEQGGGAKKTLASTLQMFKDLGHSTANLMSGKHDDEEEDPDYIKVRDYIVQLEAHLAEVHRQSQRMIERQSKLGLSMSEFGASMVALGKFESGTLAQKFTKLGERADSLSGASQKQSEQLMTTFEAPLKEFVRAVKSAKSVMTDRSTALGLLQQARFDVDAKRTKLAKLRGTAGIKEEKVAEAERELNDAQHKVENTKQTYETIVLRMSQDLSRFQKERAVELAAVLREFAITQAQLAADSSKVWQSLVSDMSAGP